MKKGLVALLMAGMLGCAPSVVAKKPPTLKQLYKNAYVIRAELVAEKRGENDIGLKALQRRSVTGKDSQTTAEMSRMQ